MALPIGFVSNLPAWQLLVLSVAAMVAALLLAGGARLPAARRLLPLLAPALLVGTLSAAAYSYFLRQPSDRIADFDAMSLRTFAWYVTPWGLLAAVIGFTLAVRRWLTRDAIFLLTLTVYAGFFFYKIRIVPEHYWMTRRFLPVILPGALLLVGYAAVGRWRETESAASPSPSRARWLFPARMAAGLVIVAVLAMAFWRQSQPLFSHVEYAGLIPRLEEMAATFGDKDLLIVESRDASDVHVLALPLAYIYARNVLLLVNRTPNPLQFKAFLDWAQSHYANVYFMGGGGTELLSREVTVEAVDTRVFQIPEWESSINALPAGLRKKSSTSAFIGSCRRATRRGRPRHPECRHPPQPRRRWLVAQPRAGRRWQLDARRPRPLVSHWTLASTTI